MANTNCGSTCGSSTTTTTTDTCTTIKPGTSYDVNQIPSAGCYVCNWNGSLLRINASCFESNGKTTFSYWSSDPLTVTYLTDNPNAPVETCREIANAAYTYFNF